MSKELPMELRTPLRVLATLLMWSNVSHAAVPEADSFPDAASYEAWAPVAVALAPAVSDEALRSGSNPVMVLLDHEGDSFIFVDASELITASAANVTIDRTLLEALEATLAPSEWQYF